MPNVRMPNPVIVANRWLRVVPAITAVAGTRIDIKLGDTFPAIRLTDIGPRDRGPEEAAYRVQIECYADDYFTARDLAAEVEAAVPELRGDYPDASGWCAGGWVESGPFSSPDESSRRYRHQLDVGMWLYPFA